MKANKLMIGDWVMSTIGEHIPVKVYMIGINFIGLRYGDVEQSGALSLCSFEPIPLTEEILKANGWKGTALYWSKHKVPFEISILVCRTTPFINGHGSVCYYIKYVHELQHALRLCGLDELADNFKLE